MRQFTKLKPLLERDDVYLQVTCPCRYGQTFPSFSAFTDEDGADVISETPIFVRCPRCRNVYSGSVTKEDTGNRSLIKIELELGSNDREVGRVSVGECPECGSDIHDTDLGEGPEKPNIGWTYYECPECSTGIRPERFGERESE